MKDSIEQAIDSLVEGYAPENYMVGDVVTKAEMEGLAAEFHDRGDHIEAVSRDGAKWRSFGRAGNFKKVSKGYKGPYAKG
jgi:hypothetical protein